MSRFLRLSLLVTAILLMIACGLSTNTPDDSNAILADTSVVKLVVQAQPTSFTSAGQVINYTYTVSNTGTDALVGPVTITDDKAGAAAQCPNVNTVGNNNDSLDAGESIICAGGYSVTQADVTAGKVVSNARARAGAIDSAIVTTTINIAENKVLTISVAANPTSYNQANQQIKYTYTIKNTGAATLGPTQFIVRDDHIPTPINCGANNAVLATNESLTCEAVYTTTQADTAVSQITNTASAS